MVSKTSLLQKPNGTAESTELDGNFRTFMEMFGDIEAEKRPSIPKLRNYQYKRSANIIYYINNNILPKCLKHSKDLNDVHALVYCAASTVMHRFVKINKNGRKQSQTPPPSSVLKDEVDDNWLFEKNEKGFYKNLKDKKTEFDGKLPDMRQIEKFWSEIWSAKQHNSEANWIEKEKQRHEDVPEMSFSEVTVRDITTVLANARNWSAPGPDKIHNFWFKKFTCCHPYLAKFFTKVICEPQKLPPFLTKGYTLLIPKSTNVNDPSQYRPITCMPTLYKMLTACLKTKIYQHFIENRILSDEQKGCMKFSRGCKELLIIDETLLKYIKKMKTNLFISYIDYKKAYDSVPHSWIADCLTLYKVNSSVINFVRALMSAWRTTLRLHKATGCTETKEIKVERGIFQGDSLSALLFCVALNPLSNLLKRSACGYKIRCRAEVYKLSHLLYMDDIKIFASSVKELNTLTEKTKHFSNTIGLEFSLNKCRQLHIIKGKIKEKSYNCEVGIQAMDDDELYPYLGMMQAIGIDKYRMKKNLKQELERRVNSLIKTELNENNLIRAINTYALSVLFYSFGVIAWTKQEISALQTFVAKKLREVGVSSRRLFGNNKYHTTLLDIKNHQEREIDSLRKYFYHEMKNSKLHRLIVKKDKYTPLKLSKHFEV